MKRSTLSLLILLAGAWPLAGCSIPLTVTRVHPHGSPGPDTIKGVRYALKRPVTRAALRVKDVPVAELSQMGRIVGNECRPYKLDLVLEQKMTETWVYEAEYTPKLLANTDATLGLGDGGILSSVSAGESDQVLPFVQAVAGLAVKAARPAGFLPGQPAPCRIPQLDALVQNEISLRNRQADLEERIEEWQTEVTQRPGRQTPDYARAREALAVLGSELARIKTAREENLHRLDPAEGLVCVDGRRLEDPARECTARDTGSWMRIDLDTEA